MPIETALPDPAVLVHPRRDVPQRLGPQLAGPPLRIPALDDQAGSLQHLEVLRDARQAHVEGLASSPTVASPDRRRARMARRVGSARAANVALRGSGCMVAYSVRCI